MNNTELNLDQLADGIGGSMHQGAMNSLSRRGLLVSVLDAAGNASSFQRFRGANSLLALEGQAF